MKQTDVVIIGAGLAGLSLGALLANSGRSVTVLEKASAVGGRMRVVEKDGFLLDWGIHAMLNAGDSTIVQVVRKTGGRLHVRPAGMCIALEGRFEQLVAENLLFQLMGTQPISVSDVGKIAWRLIRNRKEELRRLRGMSLQEWVDEVKPGPRLERMIRAIGIGLFAVEDISNASAWECAKFLGRAMSSGHALGYPAGGWQAVLEALRRPIENSEGGEIKLRSRVEEIDVRDGRASGVRLAGGEKTKAKTVVWAAPVQGLPSALPGNALGEDEKKKMKGIRSTYGVNIDFALERPVTRERRCIATLEPPTLGWFVSNIEPSTAPRGHQLLTVFSPISPENWCDRGFRKARRAALRETYIGMFPEIDKYLMWERPLDTLVNAARGDTGQTRKLRPGHSVEGLEGLLLVGDSTAGDGFGGEIAADSVLRALNLVKL